MRILVVFFVLAMSIATMAQDPTTAPPAQPTPAVSQPVTNQPQGGQPPVQQVTPGRNITKKPLESGAVYQILNKLDDSSLTIEANTTYDLPVYTKIYTGAGGQRWRLQKGYYGSSFQLIPTSKEHAVLDLDRNEIGFFGRFFAFGNQKFWNVVTVGGGDVQLQNYQRPHLCLTGKGNGETVAITKCENTKAQRWEFILI